MYQVCVNDDGSTEVRRVPEGQDAFTRSISNILEFDNWDDTAKELKDYGHDQDRIDEAKENLDASPNLEWIEV